jgi:predicted metal-binding protein
MTMEQIEAFMKEIAPLVHEMALIDTAQIPFSEEVVAACARNACGCYGKTWQCPPGVGSLEERRALCHSYDRAIVFTTKHDLEDSFDVEGWTRGRIAHEAATDRVLELCPFARRLAFSAEGCHLCEKCTYPDAPCRFPNRARVSVEANGIFVVELARMCDIRYHNGANTVTYFSMLLF